MQHNAPADPFSLDPRSVEFADRFGEFVLAAKLLDELAVRRASARNANRASVSIWY